MLDRVADRGQPRIRPPALPVPASPGHPAAVPEGDPQQPVRVMTRVGPAHRREAVERRVVGDRPHDGGLRVRLGGDGVGGERADQQVGGVGARRSLLGGDTEQPQPVLGLAGCRGPVSSATIRTRARPPA